MIVFPDANSPKLIEMINAGAIGILLTDTLYGIVARADNEQSVARIYEVKRRNDDKPPIVLISDTSQLFDPLSEEAKSYTSSLWPGKNSIILSSPSAPEWLTRNSNGVAYRLPDDTILQRLLQQTGPLIAPSANPQGMTPARTVGEAQGYFGDAVDFYVDGGVSFNDEPSNLYSIIADELVQIR